MADTTAHEFPAEHMSDPLPNGLPATRDWGFARWVGGCWVFKGRGGSAEGFACVSVRR